MCVLHRLIHFNFNQHSVFPLPSTILTVLRKVLFELLWSHRTQQDLFPSSFSGCSRDAELQDQLTLLKLNV